MAFSKSKWSNKRCRKSFNDNSQRDHPTCWLDVGTCQAWCPPRRGRHPFWGSPPGSSWPAAWWASPWCHSQAAEAWRIGTGPQRLLRGEQGGTVKCKEHLIIQFIQGDNVLHLFSKISGFSKLTLLTACLSKIQVQTCLMLCSNVYIWHMKLCLRYYFVSFCMFLMLCNDVEKSECWYQSNQAVYWALWPKRKTMMLWQPIYFSVSLPFNDRFSGLLALVALKKKKKTEQYTHGSTCPMVEEEKEQFWMSR